MMTGQWVAIIALLHSIASRRGITKLTMAITAIVLAMFAYCTYTLGLTWTCVSFAVSSLLWFVLLFKEMFRTVWDELVAKIFYEVFEDEV